MKRSLMKSGGIVLGIIFAIVLSTLDLHAQLYKTSVGVRIGGTSGVTLKHNYRPYYTFEGIVGGFDGGFSLTGLWEKNTQAFNERGFNWYYGAGPHLAFYNGRTYYRYGREQVYYRNDVAGFGVNGIIGLEYRMPDNIPIAFSFDLKPFFEVISNGDVGLGIDPGVGIKFIIN